MKHIKSVAFLTLSTILISGCKSTLNPSYEVAETNLQSSELQFKISKEFGGISEQTVLNKINDSINRSSGPRGYGWKNGSSSYKRGRYTEVEGNKITVTYANCIVQGNGCFMSKQFVTYEVDVEENEDFLNIQVTTPDLVNVKTGSALMIDVPHFTNTSDIVSDLSSINSKISFTIEGRDISQFEEESEYNPDEVFSIFKRYSKASYVRKTEAEEVYFSFDVDGLTVLAKTYPFKSGSVSEFSYSYMYSLHSDGSKSISKEDLNNKFKNIELEIRKTLKS